MASVEDIILKITARNQTQQGFKQAQESAKKSAAAIKTAVGTAMTAVGAYTLNFAKDAVQSAMTAEQEWTKFASAVKRQGINWEEQGNEIKGWAVDYSNSMGRSVTDTRAAMTTMMNYGLSLEESKKTMETVSNYAATMGMSQEQASQQIVKAMSGQGRALKALGLDIKDYQDADTKAIDKTKLLKDIMDKTSGSADSYSKTTAASMQRLENAMSGLKTDIGYAMAEALAPLIPVVTSVVKWFRELPGPVKTGMAVLVMLGAAIGLLAGPVMSIIGLVEMLGITITISFAPIYLAIAAVAVLIIALEQLGEYLGLWNGWGDMLQKMWDAIVLALKTAAQGFMSLLRNAQQAMIGLYQTVSSTIQRVLSVMLAPPLLIIRAYINFWINLAQLLVTIGSGIRNAFSSILRSAVTTVRSGISRVINQFRRILSAILNIRSSAINYAVSLGTGIYNGIVNGVKGVADFIGKEFSSIPGKILNAINGAVNAVKGFGSALWEAFKQSIGVASPSFFVKQLDKDFNLIPNVITSTVSRGKTAVVNYAKTIVGAYDTSKITPTAVNSVMNTPTVTPAPKGNTYQNNSNSNKNTVILEEGAIQLDARNLTTKESKQILLNAIEGLQDWNPTNNGGNGGASA